MGLVLLSLGLATLSGLILAILINYSIYLWESKKVDDLTSTIRHEETSHVMRGTAKHSFSSFAGKPKTLTGSSNDQIHENSLSINKKHDYPDWLNKLIEELEAFKKNAFKSIKRFFRYLVHITSPSESIKVTDVQKEQEKERKQSEIDEVVEKVSEANATKEVEEEIFPEPPKVFATQSHATSDQDEEDGDDATLGLAGLSDEKEEKDMSLFEKLETRILTKLRESGLDHYDIWVELGDLYLKFDEKEKAREVFALVLKHSEGTPKELARNRLIGL